tara:strand:- start:302 stop:451 length:150 start_codon:yes stop_codon:yes gene_type:complete
MVVPVSSGQNDPDKGRGLIVCSGHQPFDEKILQDNASVPSTTTLEEATE